MKYTLGNKRFPFFKENPSSAPPVALPPSPTYTLQTLEAICNTHSIDESLLFPLGDELEHAWCLYNLRVFGNAFKLNTKEIKRHLTKIEKQAAKLKRDLKALPTQVLHECITSYNKLDEEAMSAGERARLSRIEGKNRIKRFESMEVFPAIIELVCHTANEEIVPRQAGRPSEEALYAWVKTMSQFWENVLGRPYTLDVYQGRALTAAGNFLADCMSPIDPLVLSGIPTQMRRYMEERKSGCRN